MNLCEGQGALNGLRISNLQGFATEYAMQMARVKVTLDIESITSDVVIIKEVFSQGSALIYEMAAGGSNFDTPCKNAQTYTGNETQSEYSNSGPKLIIEHLYIHAGQIEVSP